MNRGGQIFSAALVAAGLVLAGLLSAGPAVTAERTAAVIADVPLFDDDSGQALFAGVTLAPGSTAARCITVSWTGTTPGSVLLAATNVTGTLPPSLNVTVDRGTGGQFGDCSGFSGTTIYAGTLSKLASASAAAAVPAAGEGVATGWAPTGPATATFRITLALAADAVQGAAAHADFQWRMVTSPTTAPTTTAPTTTAPTTTGPITTGPITTAPVAAPVSAPAGPQPPGSPRPSESAAPSAGSSTLPAPAVAAPLQDGGDGSGSQGVIGTVKHALKKAAQALQKALDPALDLASATVRSPGVPLGLIVLAVAFLAVQNRADRKDPKLAEAPMWKSRYVWIPLPEEDER